MSPIPFDVELQLRRHGASLRELAGELVRDPWLADDAVQEVWLGALRAPPPHEAALGGWLVTALRNAVRGRCRKERRGGRRELAFAATRSAVVEDHAVVFARAEQAQRLLAAVMTLAAPFRDAIWQRYFEGRAPRQIAASSGVPCATVKSRLQRGLQQLRRRLDDEGGPGSRAALASAFGCPGTALSATAAATVWPGVLLMTTWTKSMAGVALLAIAGVMAWSLCDPGVAPSGAALAGTAGTAGAAARTGQTDHGRPDAAAPPDERRLFPTGDQATAPAFREVRVRNDAGEPVAGATVRFVKPGFAYADLPRAQADLYSRSTERWLRDFASSRRRTQPAARESLSRRRTASSPPASATSTARTGRATAVRSRRSSSPRTTRSWWRPSMPPARRSHGSRWWANPYSRTASSIPWPRGTSAQPTIAAC